MRPQTRMRAGTINWYLFLFGLMVPVESHLLNKFFIRLRSGRRWQSLWCKTNSTSTPSFSSPQWMISLRRLTTYFTFCLDVGRWFSVWFHCVFPVVYLRLCVLNFFLCCMYAKWIYFMVGSIKLELNWIEMNN